MPRFEPGESLGHYRLIEEIGSGGMGVVWQAVDERLGRTVALKAMRDRLFGNETARQRFLREARLAAKVNHPNIATIHDIDEAEGTVFIVMEYIDGQSLSEMIASGPVDVRELVGIALGIAEGLAHAHHHDLVHRDLKPSNVAVRNEGQVKILDFGVAKSLARRASTRRGADAGQQEVSTEHTVSAEFTVSAELTRDGQILGTPSYMSPEQAVGAPVDSRSDVFALGTLLYELSTGRHPFRRDTPVETQYAILHEDVTPARELRPELPTSLQSILDRCLSRDTERRYQTTDELVSDLRELAQEIDAAPTPSRGSGGFRAPRRRGRRVGRRLGLSLAALALGAIAAVSAWRVDWSGGAAVSGGASESLSIAVLPFAALGHQVSEESEDGSAFVKGLHCDLLTRLSKVGSLQVISRTSVVGYEGTTKPVTQIADELGVATVLEGSVQQVRDRIRVNAQLIDARQDEHLWADSYDRELNAESMFRVQSEIASEITTALHESLLPGEHIDLALPPTENLPAYEHYLRGLRLYEKIDDDHLVIDLAVRSFEQAVALDPDFAVAWARLGMAHAFSYHFHHDRSAERLERARLAIERALALDPQLPEGRIARGHYLYWGFLDYEGALREFELARAERPNEPALFAGVAWVKRRQGKMGESIAEFRRWLEVDPRSFAALANLGETLSLARHYEEADEVFRRLIDFHPGVPTAYTRRAWLLTKWRGDIIASARLLEHAQRLSPGNEFVLGRRIFTMMVDRDYERALSELSATPASFSILDDQFMYRPRGLYLGLIHRWMGDEEAAITSFEQAREDITARLERSPDVPRLLGALGLTLAQLDSKAEAIEAGQRALELMPIEKEAWSGAKRVEELAMIYAWVGETDRALEQLEVAFSHPGEVTPMLVRLSPYWDALREDPRLGKLLSDHDGSPTE